MLQVRWLPPRRMMSWLGRAPSGVEDGWGGRWRFVTDRERVCAAAV